MSALSSGLLIGDAKQDSLSTQLCASLREEALQSPNQSIQSGQVSMQTSLRLSWICGVHMNRSSFKSFGQFAGEPQQSQFTSTVGFMLRVRSVLVVDVIQIESFGSGACNASIKCFECFARELTEVVINKFLFLLIFI